MNFRKMENYYDLLSIRLKAAQRDMNILGGVAIVAFILLIALGLLDEINGRSLYIVGGLVTVFWVIFLMAWVKLQIINGSIEMVYNLRLMNEDQDPGRNQ